jgi:indolepyruvate ferredoxin oxidoreductase
MLTAFSMLGKLKGLRGTPFDVFGRTAERRTERQLIGEYEALVDELLARLDRDNHPVALQLAALPEEIRGYGYVKEESLEKARTRWAELLARFRGQQMAQVIRMAPKVA